jgi:hypothetical protein
MPKSNVSMLIGLHYRPGALNPVGPVRKLAIADPTAPPPAITTSTSGMRVARPIAFTSNA